MRTLPLIRHEDLANYWTLSRATEKSIQYGEPVQWPFAYHMPTGEHPSDYIVNCETGDLVTTRGDLQMKANYTVSLCYECERLNAEYWAKKEAADASDS